MFPDRRHTGSVAALISPALAIAALGLGGCANMVISSTPLIAETEQPAQLKPGFWSYAQCVDPRAKDQPFCSTGYQISDSTIDPAGLSDSRPGASTAGEIVRPPPFSYRLGDGDPLIMQVRLESADTTAPERPFYAFLAVDPKSRDDQGRIDLAYFWILTCGPPAAPRPGGVALRPTDHPFPGAVVSGYGCHPADRAALSKIAAASRALPAKQVSRAGYRWISEQPPQHSPAPRP